MPLVGALAVAALAVAAGGAPPTAARESPPDAYVSLGDSFTAAPLVPEPTGDPYDCGRSTRNYPHLVAAAIEAPVFRDVSCGGARTRHLSEPQTGLPLGGTNPPQFDALGPDVALLTIGIGGNDIGFGEIVERCAQPPAPVGRPCADHYTADGGDELRERIDETAPRIAQALTDARRLAPNAAIYLVGYPALLPHAGDGCYPYVPILPPDVHYLRGIQHALNDMLREEAAANGATYVDWYGPSIGHDACEPPPEAWVNGIVVVPPSYPAHPNQFGTAGGARAVLDALGDFSFPAEGDTATSGGSASGTGRVVRPAAAHAAGAQPLPAVPALPATGPPVPAPAAFGLASAAVAGLALRRRTCRVRA